MACRASSALDDPVVSCPELGEWRLGERRQPTRNHEPSVALCRGRETAQSRTALGVACRASSALENLVVSCPELGGVVVDLGVVSMNRGWRQLTMCFQRDRRTYTLSLVQRLQYVFRTVDLGLPRR